MKLKLKNYKIPNWMYLVKEQNPGIIKSYKLAIVPIDQIDLDNSDNVARAGGVHWPTVDEIAQSIDDEGYRAGEEPVVVTEVKFVSGKSIPLPYELEFGFHRGNAVKSDKQKKISEVPVVIIEWEDGLSEDKINFVLSQLGLAENHNKLKSKQQTKEDDASGYWNMVKDFKGDKNSNKTLMEQKIDELHDRLKALVRVNRKLYEAGEPFVKPFHRYQNVREIIKDMRASKGVTTPPWNMHNYPLAQEWVDRHFDKEFIIPGFGKADQLNLKSKKPYAPSSESDEKAYVLYYFSNGKDRIYGELITILSEQRRDGVHIPIFIITQATSAEDINNIEKTTINHIKGIDQRLELLNQIPEFKRVRFIGIIPSDKTGTTQNYNKMINYQSFRQDKMNAKFF